MAIGDTFVHWKKIARNDQIGFRHRGIHARNYFRNIFVGLNVEFAQLVDRRVDFLEEAHPVAQVGLLPVWTQRQEFDAGGLYVLPIVRNGGEAHLVASLLHGNRQRDYWVDVAG